MAPEALGQLRLGSAIPVIDPADPLRRARWTNILEWYGLPQGSPSELLRERVPPPGLHPVVCVDADCAALASWYASVQDRPYHHISSVDAIDAVMASAPDSLLLVGRFGAFPARIEGDLNLRLPIPWGLVTSVDVAGVSFLLAKQLALRWFS